MDALYVMHLARILPPFLSVAKHVKVTYASLTVGQ